MNRFFLAVFLLSSLFVSAHADEEASNRPVVRSSEYGGIYAKSIPEEEWGQRGITRVYRVDYTGDTMLAEYDWFSNEIYIGGPGDATIVRFGPWQRGREPQDDHFAIGFYRNGQVIREYSTLEMENLGSGVSVSVSHYEVFGARPGFRYAGDDLFVFEVEGVNGKLFSFDLETGDIIN